MIKTTSQPLIGLEGGSTQIANDHQPSEFAARTVAAWTAQHDFAHAITTGFEALAKAHPGRPDVEEKVLSTVLANMLLDDPRALWCLRQLPKSQ